MDRTKVKVLIAYLFAIFAGIIANLATPYLPPLVASVAQYIATNLLPWIFVAILFCIVGILLFRERQSKSKVNSQLQEMSAAPTPQEKLWAAAEEYMNGGAWEKWQEAKRQYAPNIYKEIKKPSLVSRFEEVAAKLFS